MRPTRGLFADPFLRLLALVGVLVVPWFLIGPGGVATGWLAQSGIDVLIVVLAARIYRIPGIERHARRFWVALAVGVSCSVVGDSYRAALAIGGDRSLQANVVQNSIDVAGVLIIVITMLFHPLGGSGRQRLRMWLDAATVLTAVTVFLWYFQVARELSGGRLADRLAFATNAGVLLMVAFGLIKLIFSASAPFHAAAGAVGALGVIGTALAAPAAEMLTGHSDPAVMLLVQVLSCLLVPVGLRMQEVLTRLDGGPRARAEEHRFSRLPYVAVIATQLLLVTGLATVDPGMRIWGVAVGVLIITGLVLARQQVAFRDNERLVSELTNGKEWFSALVQHASDLTVVVGADDTIQYASPAAERALGTTAGRVAGDTLGRRLHPDDQGTLNTLNERLATAMTADAEIRLRRDDGEYRWVHVIATDLRANTSVRGIVWNGRDITESHQLQVELRHQATHDALTGLANRVLLQQRVRETAPDAPICMLLVDLDGFKQVNDSHGHHAGDEVLITAARRISTLLGDAGTVARLGGDEFAVLLPGADPARAAALAALITSTVAEPIPVRGAVVTVGASVGVAAGTSADADRLLRDADDAMYRSKQSRRATTPT